MDHFNSEHSTPPIVLRLFYCNNSAFSHNFTVDLCWYIHMDIDFYTKVLLTSLVVIIGVIGNVLLGGTILFSSRLRTKSINIFIVNLSISNILQLLIVPTIVTVDNLTEFFELGYIGCKSKMFLTNWWACCTKCSTQLGRRIWPSGRRSWSSGSRRWSDTRR